MPTGSAILPHIDGSLVGYKAQGSDFLALVQQTLGNAGSSSDGWDTAIAAVMSLFPSTDAGLASLDLTLSDLSSAVGDFNAIDTTSWASDFIGALPALESLVGSAKLAPVAPLSLPSLPPAPTPRPPPKPPTVCLPAPPPPAPTPTPTPPPTPPPAQPPCPQGWSFVAGKCQPPPIPQPSKPGAPPVILPPLPAGLPPCPPAQFFVPGQPCQNYPDPGNAFTNYVLPIAGEVADELTAITMTQTATAWVGTLGLTPLTAIPIAGAIIAVAALVFFFLGGGCGEACVDASKVEQIWEAVCDNLYLVARAGMIDSAHAVVGMHHFFTMGDLALARLKTPQGTAGAVHMFSVLNAEIAAAQALPARASVPFNLQAARALYVGGPGWYPDSITYANQLTDQFLTGLTQAS